MQMNYYPKILPFYMTYPMPLIWEEEDTVMRDTGISAGALSEAGKKVPQTDRRAAGTV